MIRRAVYAGTFDPMTRGHLSVVERAHRLFDEVWVLVANNPDKKTLLSSEERMGLIATQTRGFVGVHVGHTDGFVVDYAQMRGAQYLIRGVRSAMDLEHETMLANLNRNLAPHIETIFVPANPAMSEVSSSRLKEMIRTRTDVSLYCTYEVAEVLRQRLTKEREVA